jgi:hypothetical protein
MGTGGPDFLQHAVFELVGCNAEHFIKNPGMQHQRRRSARQHIHEWQPHRNVHFQKDFHSCLATGCAASNCHGKSCLSGCPISKTNAVQPMWYDQCSTTNVCSTRRDSCLLLDGSCRLWFNAYGRVALSLSGP